LVCEAIGTAATPGLLCQPRMIVKMIVEKQMECRLAGETELFEENLPQRHFCPSQNPTWPDQGLNPGRRGGKPVTNRLSYGAAKRDTLNYVSSYLKLRRKNGSACYIKRQNFCVVCECINNHSKNCTQILRTRSDKCVWKPSKWKGLLYVYITV
jgi:hypothetical protein